jgi:hypothetical protein
MFLFEPCAAWRRTAKGKNHEPGLQEFCVSKITGRRAIFFKTPKRGFFILREASKLLCLREELESRSVIRV